MRWAAGLPCVAERHLPRAPSMATVPTVAMLIMALGATTHQRQPCLHPHQQEALYNNVPLLLLMMLMLLLLLRVLQLKVLRAPQAAATSPPPGQRQPRGARLLTHERTRSSSSARCGL